MSNLKFLLVLLVLFAFVSPIFVLKGHASSHDAAASAISQTEEVLASAYEAVLEAEQTGANVSGLLTQLNDAGELLVQARIAYRLGNFDEAVRSADLCYEIGERVKSKAYELRFERYGPQVMGVVLTITGSMIGVVVVSFGSFWGWRVFKRRYYQRVLRMKPEVVSDES